jgi:hypothetical protein
MDMKAIWLHLMVVEDEKDEFRSLDQGSVIPVSLGLKKAEKSPPFMTINTAPV